MIDNFYNEKTLFLEDLYNNNWPFSFILAERLVRYNGFHYCGSLKTFLLNTAIGENSGEESDIDSVENGNLVDSRFHLEGGKVYYYPLSSGVNEGRVSQEATSTMYCMDNISYDSLMGEAIKFLKKFYTFFLLEKVISPKERLLNLLSFSNLSKNKRETFVENVFKTESFQEMISYYQIVLSESGYL